MCRDIDLSWAEYSTYTPIFKLAESELKLDSVRVITSHKNLRIIIAMT